MWGEESRPREYTSNSVLPATPPALNRWQGLAPTRNGYKPRAGVRAIPFPYHTYFPGVGSYFAPLIVPGFARAKTRRAGRNLKPKHEGPEETRGMEYIPPPRAL